jgi:hypothetical protein
MIDSEYSSRIALTKFSILAKLQPKLKKELQNSDTTASEKRAQNFAYGYSKFNCMHFL